MTHVRIQTCSIRKIYNYSLDFSIVHNYLRLPPPPPSRKKNPMFKSLWVMCESTYEVLKNDVSALGPTRTCQMN